MPDFTDLTIPLKQLFGFDRFRPHQQEVIAAIMRGADSLTIMPTGGGKSLCYQLPASLMPGVSVVVSPLISLMKDQVDAARAQGLSAATLNSQSSADERRMVWEELKSGRLKLLYVSPERLLQPEFFAVLQKQQISFFAIDEAHCISQWGHDFRPDYLGLGQLAGEFPDVPVAAFTATATRRVAEDICSRLGLRNPHLTLASFNRPNLYYQVIPKLDFKRQLVEFVSSRPDESGIIYRTTRKNVDETCAWLRQAGIEAESYHAGLDDAERRRAQEDFRQDRCRVMVATIAFGMGIDKPNVRYVVHGDLPKNVEGYYQETGRAGRDNDPASCVLFYSRADVPQLIRFADGVSDETARTWARNQVWQMLAYTQKDACRRKQLLAYFGEEMPGENCGNCDICLGEVEREEVSREGQMALSGMVRTDSRFGAEHLIDLLRGKASERLMACGHDKLPTFGVGREHPRKYWRVIIDSLLNQGFAEVDDEMYPCPRPTPKGWQLLRGECGFQILKQPARQTKRASRAWDAGAENGQEAGVPACNQQLFERLREARAQEAASRGIPPYHIFSDRTLRELAAKFPLEPEELLAISGIGAHKRDTWGELVLRVIRDFAGEFPEQLPEGRDLFFAARKRADLKAQPEQSGQGGQSERKQLSSTIMVSRDLLLAGHGLEETARLRNLKPGTIVSHIEELVSLGQQFDAHQFFSPNRWQEIERAFAASPGHQLKPVAQALYSEPVLDSMTHEQLSEIYTDLKLARALLIK